MPDSHPEPAVFGTAVEALVQRALRGRMDAKAVAGLKALKIDPDHIQAAYDYPTWVALQKFLCETLYVGVPREQALYQLGLDYMRGLEQTLVGKAIFAMARLSGPRKMLERMTRNVRTANNYMESELEPQPDGSFRFHYRVVPALLPAMRALPPPSLEYFRAILFAGLEALNAKDIAVTIEQHDEANRSAVYRVKYRS